MNNNVIKPGDKVEIRIIQRVEQGKRLGENPPAYYSMVEDVQENGLIEMLAPTRAGKAESIPGGLRLEFVFYTRRGAVPLRGTCEGPICQGTFEFDACGT